MKNKEVKKGEKVNPDGSVIRFPGKEQLLKPVNKADNLVKYPLSTGHELHQVSAGDSNHSWNVMRAGKKVGQIGVNTSTHMTNTPSVDEAYLSNPSHENYGAIYNKLAEHYGGISSSKELSMNENHWKNAGAVNSGVKNQSGQPLYVIKPQLNKGINLLEKWALIKAKLNHEKAFKDMDIFGNEQEQQPQEQQPQEQQPQEQQPQEQQPQEQQPVISSEQQQLSEGDDQQSDGQESDEQLQQPPETSENQSSEVAAGASETEDLPPLEGDELKEALKELGYSDVEIAHIVHGHAPAIPSEEEQDLQAHEQNLGQDEEGHKQTLGHRDEEHAADLDHKKQMQALELEYMKKEKELKLKHLSEELAIKRSRMKEKSSEGKK